MEVFALFVALFVIVSFVAPLYLGITLGMPLRFGFSSVALILLCVYAAFSLFLGFACQQLTGAHLASPLHSLAAFGSGLVLGPIWSYLLYDVLYDDRTMRIKWSNLLPRGLRRRN